MPGIVCLVNPESRLDSHRVMKRMFEVMKHEKFYQTDQLTNPPVALGRIHLGVLNPEQQPIFNEDREKCIVMAGEIYNSESLLDKLGNRHRLEFQNDPELILHLYEEFGLEFPSLLNGSFTLGIWDSKKKRLIIVNDRYGLNPTYYAAHDGILAFAPEIKGILEIDGFPRVLNKEAVADFFSFGYPLGDKTFLEGVRVLPPASICTAKGRDASFSIKSYWDFQFQEEPMDVRDAVLEFNRLLRKAVRVRANKEERLGLALSGGFDSRALLAAMDANLHSQILAFTFGAKGTNDERISRIISDELGLQHRLFDVSASQYRESAEKVVYITDGMYLGWGAYLAYQRLKKHVDIIFVGSEGSLVSGGYLSKEIMKASTFKEWTEAMLAKANKIIPHNQQSKFYSRDYSKLTSTSLGNLQKELGSAKGSSLASKTDYVYAKNRIRRFLFLGLAQARSFLECRTPFFDNDLIDFIQRVPSLARSGIRKYLLPTCYPNLSKIPIHSSSHIHLDAGSPRKRISDFQKKVHKRIVRALLLTDPYTSLNIHNRFRTDLRDFVESILLDSRTLGRPLFNPQYIENSVQIHMKGRKDLGLQLEALMTFELWQRMFID
ncbi:MAG: hypothetical protein JSV58_05130 [Candidatus Bathyarchaeota archaeon]|nr:MAG: hypothetical protein JSV58_05130 [Candidatus Bathyarchaeota archaeon]